MAPIVHQRPSPSFIWDTDWWRKTIIYHIYPRSFCDGNGDGFGDLQGIISKIDYFKHLNVNCIWLSPIYKSPMLDNGYDISDYCDIDPVFGSLKQFDELVAKLHQQDIKLIMDMVPNHCSSDHPWFKEAKKSRDNPYSNYFVWSDGRRNEAGLIEPPNNWLSLFGGSMWSWCEDRQQFYLHQFLPEMPDLNFRNPKVCQEIEKVFEFWLDRGVDGFRVDSTKHLIEAENLFQNEEPTGRTDLPEGHYDTLRHRFTIDQPETHEIVESWRRLLDKYQQKDGRYRFMVQEIYEDKDTNIDEVMKHYHNGSDAPFNFRLVVGLNADTSGFALRRIIDEWMENLPQGKWPIWVLGNHDQPRIADKFGHEYADALNTLLLLLPGTPVTYYGEEIGMRGRNVSFEETQDIFSKRFGQLHYHKFSRDRARGPMWWSSSENAGFCPPGVKPWLPLHEHHLEKSVERQQTETPSSHLQYYRKLATLRLEAEFQNGTFKSGFTGKNLYSFSRSLSSTGCRYDVLVNVGKETEILQSPVLQLFGMKQLDDKTLPQVLLWTANVREDQILAWFACFPHAPLIVYPGQAFVIKSTTKMAA